MDIETQMLEKKLFLPIVGNVKLIKNAVPEPSVEYVPPNVYEFTQFT